MTIVDEYLYYQEKYEKKYGKDKSLVLMQVGHFMKHIQQMIEGLI